MVYKILCIDLVNKCSVLYGTTPKCPLNCYDDDAQVILDGGNGMLSEAIRTFGAFLGNKVTFSEYVTYAPRQIPRRRRSL